MLKMVLATLTLLSPFNLFYINVAIADNTPSCIPHNVCVHSGNYLKYHIAQGNVNGSETYTFGSMTDSNSIIVTKQNYLENNKSENDTIILDIRTGYGHSEQDNTTAIPFLVVLPTPIQYNQSDISVVHTLKNFNGFNRTVLVAVQTSSNSSLIMEYDIQTGILLDAHSLKLEKLSGQPIPVGFFNDLIDTNIINSNSLQNNIVIPAWIKNTAGWWSNGTIGDADFVKAIQFLISNEIMQIPHGSSGNNSEQEIPSWVKSNAGWWSQGKISDDDFISGIQYLINSGIVKV